jgi:hypothetical protein
MGYGVGKEPGGVRRRRIGNTDNTDDTDKADDVDEGAEGQGTGQEEACPGTCFRETRTPAIGSDCAAAPGSMACGVGKERDGLRRRWCRRWPCRWTRGAGCRRLVTGGYCSTNVLVRQVVAVVGRVLFGRPWIAERMRRMARKPRLRGSGIASPRGRDGPAAWHRVAGCRGVCYWQESPSTCRTEIHDSTSSKVARGER